jgi:hypothetical protein
VDPQGGNEWGEHLAGGEEVVFHLRRHRWLLIGFLADASAHIVASWDRVSREDAEEVN